MYLWNYLTLHGEAYRCKGVFVNNFESEGQLHYTCILFLLNYPNYNFQKIVLIDKYQVLDSLSAIHN